MQGEVILRLLKFAAVLSALLALLVSSVAAETSSAELLPLFPERIGSYKRLGPPRVPDTTEAGRVWDKAGASTVLEGLAEYSGGLRVQVVRFHQDADAYTALTMEAAAARSRNPNLQITNDYGTAGFSDGNGLTFFKGVQLVKIEGAPSKNVSSNLSELATLFSETLDKGEGEIPVLIKHLPEPDEASKKAVFVNRFPSVQFLTPNQSVLSVVQTDRDADAAYVELSSGKVLVVEYHTPQLAKENDDRIIAKIRELWTLGQPAPIGYRRVGNYSVFVFDAADDATAKQLIGEVKYEQLVQWLGRNPYIYQEAERRYVETTLGVFIAVVKASGFALVGCVGLGGLIGALLFTRRRAQQRAQDAYSDAGGMLRLNIDELTPETDPARLLGPGR